jgi:hypothetical protein
MLGANCKQCARALDQRYFLPSRCRWSDILLRSTPLVLPMLLSLRFLSTGATSQLQHTISFRECAYSRCHEKDWSWNHPPILWKSRESVCRWTQVGPGPRIMHIKACSDEGRSPDFGDLVMWFVAVIIYFMLYIWPSGQPWLWPESGVQRCTIYIWDKFFYRKSVLH